MTLWRNKRHKVWADDGFNFVIEAIKTTADSLRVVRTDKKQ